LAFISWIGMSAAFAYYNQPRSPMKISRRMQRQVEIIIRHAQSQELPHVESPRAVGERDAQAEKTPTENGSVPR
jgi:hypothetical protein